ncbi:MAG: hypothetical protein ABFC34_12020 [Methanobacterium sp.]
MKKIKFGKIKGKKVEALIGLIFFVGLVAVGATVFTGGSVSEVPQLLDTVPVSPSDLPSDVASSGADPGPQDDSGVSGSGSGSAFIVKKYYSSDYPTETTESVQAATETEIYDQPSTDVPSDDEDQYIDPDEEYLDPGDIEEVNDTDTSDEEPIPDDDDEFVDDDDTPEDDEIGDDDVIEEPDEEDIDPGDVEPVDDDEEIPDDLPDGEDLEDWLNS